uniref:Uncharacterized protein n=1 Tax=Fibrocapsa japonica TaxID=94617 RepID=A0A7S2V105_9STRA
MGAGLGGEAAAVVAGAVRMLPEALEQAPEVEDWLAQAVMAQNQVDQTTVNGADGEGQALAKGSLEGESPGFGDRHPLINGTAVARQRVSAMVHAAAQLHQNFERLCSTREAFDELTTLLKYDTGL